MTSSDSGGLERFWITFDLAPAPTYEGVVVDGDLPLEGGLRSGVGVTAFGLDDALGLVAAWLIEWNLIAAADEMPPISSAESNVDVDSLRTRKLGNPAWRGIWSPPDNLGGPTPTGTDRR